ncbi:zinc metallopeptidase [Alistipes sp. OttesenSCG-928-L06]|nr:zinc metallopeptidase [Alistipes sp. OttesenSCG-928-L06]
MSPEIWMIILVAVVGFIVQARLQSVFAKYSKVPFPGGLTGRDVAEKMLRDNGINDVQVVSTRGSLTDNFNPTNKTVNLSEPVFGTPSVSAAAVAAHECGHALQHARGYAPLKMRSALVPVVSFASRYAMWVVIGGILMINTFPALFWLGIGMLAVSLLFSLVTLPVEINASRRALSWLDSTGMLNAEQQSQAKQALTWAAMTYVVAALSALTTIIYYLGFARNRD